MRLQNEISDLSRRTPWWGLIRIWLITVYRPERHYMRGPGPRWREKYGRSAHRPTRSQVSAVQHEALKF
jgi:hypothetical protein